jgi:hypothetical protein
MDLVRLSLTVAVLIAASSTRSAEPQINVITDDTQRPIAVEVTGLEENHLSRLRRLNAGESVWYDVLGVYVLDSNDNILAQSLAGRHEIVGQALRFTPQFTLRAGTNYQVRFLPSDAARAYTKEIKIPALPPPPPTTVTAVFPSASTLPENQLRFYVHFSAPMAAGDSYAHVKLLKANGEAVHRPFLEIGEELWDGTGTRLTLLFDPGRVKKGLAPREMFGPVLEAGKAYRLVIDKAWLDANGQKLAAGYEKRFTAGPAIETALDYKQWQIEPPAAGTQDPLVIRFPRPLDRALQVRMINVAGPSGQTIKGDITVKDDERKWECRPEEPWLAGNYSLVVDTALEDSAGNNLARPFEVDVFDRVDDRAGPELMRIPFVIRGR